MKSELCHYCKQQIPTGQSYYEGKETQVCLSCYQLCKPCQSCGFPAKEPLNHPRLGQVCAFCFEAQEPAVQGQCHLCSTSIQEGERHYADQGVKVCLQCFNTTKVRCFTCRFPSAASQLDGQGGVCEFCQPKLVTKESDIKAILSPLGPFLAAFGHKVQFEPVIEFIDWRVILGMQREDPPKFPVHFFDELVHWSYPIYHLGGKLYAAPGISPEWFIPLAAGQLVGQMISLQMNEPHLGKRGAKFHFPRAWVHFLTYFVALKLGYQDVSKKLLRWPEFYVGPEFEDLVKKEKKLGAKGVIQVAAKRLKESY